MKTEIEKAETPEEKELRKKSGKLAELETELAQSELDLATLRAELNAFEALYIRKVGGKYAKLDEIEAQIAEAKLRVNPTDENARREAKQARTRAHESREATGIVQKPGYEKFFPSEKLKKLYREVAKRIHPDLAEDDFERSSRQKLMAEANKAYEEGDEEKLHAILTEWESSPESVKGKGPGADLIRVIRKIAQAEARVRAIESEIFQLKKTDLYNLKIKAEEIGKKGRDLLDEMAANLENRIDSAKRELQKIKRYSNNE